MKKIVLYLFLLSLFSVYKVYAQQGIGTDLPDKSAALEIVSSKRGLLIPRFGIPDLDQADPVTNPAHALLVFNDGSSSTNPGFYWWDENANNGNGRWKAVTGEVSDPGEAEVSLTAENPISVQNQGDNNWEISFEAGQEGEVLVTDQNGEAVWTSIEDFLNDLTIEAENGITISEDPTTQESIIQLGGILTEENTVIETGGEDNTLDITNLIDITDEVQNEETD